MPFSIYGLIIGIAVVVWWTLVERQEPKTARFIPWLLVAALVGARIYHVVDYWEYYQIDWTKIINVWEGGISIWGALIAGCIFLLFTQRQYLNIYVLPLPLAQAIGRVANGVAGEFGNVVLWGIPWWGAEAILDLILFGMIWSAPPRLRVVIYACGYGIIRLLLSPYR